MASVWQRLLGRNYVDLHEQDPGRPSVMDLEQGRPNNVGDKPNGGDTSEEESSGVAVSANVVETDSTQPETTLTSSKPPADPIRYYLILGGVFAVGAVLCVVVALVLMLHF